MYNLSIKRCFELSKVKSICNFVKELSKLLKIPCLFNSLSLTASVTVRSVRDENFPLFSGFPLFRWSIWSFL